MIYNIRGTSGSGKTTVVRELIKRCGGGELIEADGKLFGYKLLDDQLRVLGRYDDAIKGGGVDNITGALFKRYEASGTTQGRDGKKPNSMDAVDAQVRKWHAAGKHVIFEGLIVTSVWYRWKDMAEQLPYRFLWLDTPLEVCQARVQQRNGGKPLISKSLEDKHYRSSVHRGYAERDGLQSHVLRHEYALDDFVDILRRDGLPIP